MEALHKSNGGIINAKERCHVFQCHSLKGSNWQREDSRQSSSMDTNTAVLCFCKIERERKKVKTDADKKNSHSSLSFIHLSLPFMRISGTYLLFPARSSCCPLQHLSLSLQKRFPHFSHHLFIIHIDSSSSCLHIHSFSFF